MNSQKPHILALTEDVATMFIHGGVLTRNEAVDFLDNTANVASSISRRHWNEYVRTTMINASKLIVNLTQNSRSSNSHGRGHGHGHRHGSGHGQGRSTSHGHSSSHSSSHSSNHSSRRGTSHGSGHGHRSSSHSSQIPSLKLTSPSSLQVRAVVSGAGVLGVPGVPGVAIAGGYPSALPARAVVSGVSGVPGVALVGGNSFLQRW
jgi:hypothetical protein